MRQTCLLGADIFMQQTSTSNYSGTNKDFPLVPICLWCRYSQQHVNRCRALTTGWVCDPYFAVKRKKKKQTMYDSRDLKTNEG